MAKITKAMADKDIRDRVFKDIFTSTEKACLTEGTYQKINDRQWGVILTDANGDQRYIRIGAIVAELRDDMTAEELMQSEIDAYNQKQADKAEKAKAKEKKIAKDKARREAEAKAKEGEQA
jgi:DNA-directed RNA polymerase delta subunit